MFYKFTIKLRLELEWDPQQLEMILVYSNAVDQAVTRDLLRDKVTDLGVQEI